MSIMPFLRGGVFDSGDVRAMSMALDDVFRSLNLLEGDPAREVSAGDLCNPRVVTRARIGMRFSAEHRLNISDGKSGTRWVTNLYTSQERLQASGGGVGHAADGADTRGAEQLFPPIK